MTCIRCNQEYVPDDFFIGCLNCLETGYPASLQVQYNSGSWEIDATARGMFRYVDRLPYRTFPTLGEGETPIIEVEGCEEQLGISKVWIKNEGQNPTGSHKDRMSPLIVARAASLGYTTVVAASSGNAGASLSAYAAAAGLKCKIVSTEKIHEQWEKAITATGADIVKVEHPSLRWALVEKMVEEEDCYPATNYYNPPVGSNLFGVQGYLTVGLEIVEQMRNNLPTAVIIPFVRGDLLWGVWAGLEEAKNRGWIEHIPRIYAVEPYPRLELVLGGADYRETFPGDSSLMPSIGGQTITYQAYDAVRCSRGKAVSVTNEEVADAQAELGRKGFYAEGSSATAWRAVSKLVQSGELQEQDRVLLIMTSHGYKGV